MKTIDILKRARDLIADPARWTKDVLARDAAGKQTPPESPGAVCWCAEGAVWRALADAHCLSAAKASAALDCLHYKSEGICGDNIHALNDYHGHASVMEAYKAAIEDFEAA